MADEEIVEVITDGPGTVVVTPVDPNPEFIEINNGQMGPRGPEGPRGPAGAAGLSLDEIAYTFVQAVASDTWTITHPLNFTPTVTVVDSAGNEHEGSIRYDGQTIIIRFSGAFSGTAYLS